MIKNTFEIQRDGANCRTEFENWAKRTYSIDRHPSLPDQYLATGVECAWQAWQAAWNAKSQDAEDARRYRWLRNTTDGSVENAVIDHRWEESWLLYGEGLDEAIDAAMQGK